MKHPSTYLETRRLEILAEMEEHKNRLLREMSGVDKETLKQLREIVANNTNGANGSYTPDNSLGLEKLSSRARSVTMNDYVTPHTYEVEGYDFTTSLKMCVENHKNVLIPEGEHLVSDTIDIPDGVRLGGCGSGNTTLIFTSDKDCFTLGQGSALENLKIEFSNINYNKTAIAIHETNVMRTDFRVSNVVIKHAFASRGGKGIEITCMGNTVVHGIGYGVFENVTIWNMEYGLYINDNQKNGGGWVNSMRSNHCAFIGCCYGIYIESEKSSGNVFDFIYQSDEYTKSAIYCRGTGNIFRGYCWDMLDFPNALLATFTRESSWNKLYVGNNNRFYKIIKDEGIFNEIPEYNPIDLEYPTATQVCHFDTPTHEIEHSPKINGDQNNCLAFANKKAVVTIEGDVNEDFSADDIFNPFIPFKWSPSRILYTNSDEAKITIDFGANGKVLNKLCRLGVVFGDGRIAKNIKVDLEYFKTKKAGTLEDMPTTSAPLTSSLLIENNKDNVIEFDLNHAVRDASNNTIVPSVSKITFTFTRPDAVAGYNPNRYTTISTIYGVQNFKNNNTPFLAKCGGEMYGNVVFENGGVLMKANDKVYKITIDSSGNVKATQTTI